MAQIQKITPFLWFDDRIEEAVTLYTSVFKDAKILSTVPGPNGTVMAMTFELEGLEFMALNGGPQFTFTEAVSFFVKCETQAEVDYFWTRLTENGGQESQCGWLKDRFGLSWQIIPNALMTYLGNPDAARAQRVMQAMLQMHKIDIAALDAAYAG